jgi:hypothetical protein
MPNYSGEALSPGRRLLELKRGGEVLLPSADGYEAVPALCRVARYYLSAHADRPGITAHLSRYPSQRAVLVHGESNARHGLLEALKAERHVDLPKNGEWIDLLAPSSFSRIKPSQQSQTPAKPAEVSKLRRFKTEATLAVTGNRLTLTFDDQINLEHLFPDGPYSVTVLKGEITKAELKQRAQPAAPPLQLALSRSPDPEPLDFARDRLREGEGEAEGLLNEGEAPPNEE